VAHAGLALFLLTFLSIQIYEVGKASARYEVKNVAYCVLRFWLLAAYF
jgi:hypothetical protein